MRRTLTDTSLWRLYLHHLGDSEVPRDFHRWACLSLVASTVANRVWLTKLHKPLYPNLYVALVGPSGCGMGEAITDMLAYAAERPEINVFRGVVTAQKLLRRMGVKPGLNGQPTVDGGRVFLVTPEVGMSFKSGEQADDMVKFLADVYSGSPVPITKDTVGGGETLVLNACINWIAGSNEKWLVESMPPSAVDGGFVGARLVCVYTEYDYDKRIYEPTVPADAAEIADHLHTRLGRLVHLEGEFTLTPEARACDKQWYDTRPSPDDAVEAPAWRRAHDLVLKLALIQSLCDWTDQATLQIQQAHVEQAQRWVAKVLANVPRLARAVAETSATTGLTAVEEYLADHGAVLHFQLAEFARRHQVSARHLREHLELLRQAQRVDVSPSSQGTLYTWRGRRRRAGDS